MNERKAEGRFRLWAFHQYYEKSFADVKDQTIRFGKALEASCLPIRDKSLVLDWAKARRATDEPDLDEDGDLQDE